MIENTSKSKSKSVKHIKNIHEGQRRNYTCDSSVKSGYLKNHSKNIHEYTPFFCNHWLIISNFE